MKVKFIIPGQPVGKGRPKFSTVCGHVNAYTPQKTVNFENLVKIEYRRQCGDFMFRSDAPLDMRITAYMAVPKSASKKNRLLMLSGAIRPIKKPDSSNITKSVEDALNKIAYYDDTQIVDSQIRRFYSENPRTVVTIQEVEDISHKEFSSYKSRNKGMP